MENMLPQQIEAGAAVHATFDELEAVALPLDWAIAPGLDDGSTYGRFVLPKPGSEATEAVLAASSSHRSSLVGSA